MSNPTYVVMQTRLTILELLERRGYTTEPYKAMNLEALEKILSDSTKRGVRSDSLRMDVTHTKDETKKACVLFLLYPIKASVTNGSFLASLFKTQEKFSNQEEPTTSIVNQDDPSVPEFTDVLVNYIPAESNEDTAPYDKLAYLIWKKHKVLIQFFPLGTLVSNPLNHVLQPKFETITDKDTKDEILKFWYAKSASQLPMIRFHTDMAARCLGLTPGDFVKITPASLTAGEYVKYRVCQP
jgi:DNA-directed RNA polymerase subunit H (RpoH/RPB5)